MRIDSTASDLMSILHKKYDWSNDDPDATKGFASVLAGIMGGSAYPQAAPSTAAAPAERSSPAPTHPLTDGGYVPPPGYEEFRDTVLNAKNLEYTDDMKDYDPATKTTMLNKKGREYTYENRMKNAVPILPSSIAEARERSAASYDHLEKYLYDMFEENGIQTIQGLIQSYGGSYSPWGLVFDNLDEGERTIYNDMLNSPEGREVAVLSEEYALYSAIAYLADADPKFAKAFDADPHAAVEKYSNRLGVIMESASGKIEYPSMNNLPNDPASFIKGKKTLCCQEIFEYLQTIM